jgi:hypothetical protein
MGKVIGAFAALAVFALIFVGVGKVFHSGPKPANAYQNCVTFLTGAAVDHGDLTLASTGSPACTSLDVSDLARAVQDAKAWWAKQG